MKFNILHTETLKRWGGQQNRVLSESIGLTQRGHKVVIACNRGSELAQRAAAAGLTVYELDLNKKTYLKTIPQLIRIIKKEEIDMVSTHSSVDSWAGGIAAIFSGRKLVRFRHNLFPIGRDPLTRLVYIMPDKIIPISKSINNLLAESGINSNKLSVIPSSVDMERFNPDVQDIRNELNAPSDALIIGNTSTFSRTKGQQYIFRAFNIIAKELPCYLALAGKTSDHTMEKYLPEIDNDLLKRVIFLNERNDIPSVLKSLDIFIYPSVIEGLGTALLEAMAMERPVVVSDIDTFKDFIEDGVNGIFFRSEDHEDLAKKILSLMNNRKLMKELGENARKTILERFTIDKMIDDTEALYSKIMDSGKRR